MTAINNGLKFIPSVDANEEDMKTETTYYRVFSTICHPSEPTTKDQMNLVEASGVLDFWDDQSEDIYTEKDGDAV